MNMHCFSFPILRVFIPATLLVLFAACGQTSSSSTKDSEQEQTIPANLVDSPIEKYQYEGCFQLTESEGDAMTTTFVSFEINGSEVFGEEAIEMTGPEYNAVAVGSLEGQIKDGVITVLYDYTIEGYRQFEEQEFKIQDTIVLMSYGEMKEYGDTMILEQKGLFNRQIPKIACE